MIRQSFRPIFHTREREALLKAMGDARYRASLCGGASGFGSPLHRLCTDMQKAIDALAADLTGDPSYFALKPTPRTHWPE